MDARTHLRRRVGDTPLRKAPNLAKAIGCDKLYVKLEGTNPTGTQKDRIARLEVSLAATQGSKGVSVASCGNFGVAMAHAAYVHDLPCHVFIPANFGGERVALMESLEAIVHRVEGSYEDAVQASRQHAKESGCFDSNPGGPSTLRTMAGYARIADEILGQLPDVAAIGVPIGNGSTLAGIHLGFRTAWARGTAAHTPRMFGGSSRDNNPVISAMARQQERCTPLDPRSIVETEVNEPLVNWDALDGTACLTALQDSQGSAYGFSDEELMRFHDALIKDGIDAHPASLAAVGALAEGLREFDVEGPVVAVLTSGRAQILVERDESVDIGALLDRMTIWLARYGDPRNEMTQAVEAAVKNGMVLHAYQGEEIVGHAILTPMELDTFFPKLHLSYIAVNPAARGLGVGTMLLESAIRESDGELSLHVDTDNEGAIRLYEKFGFTKKYYRMLHASGRTPDVDPSHGSGWLERESAS